ncbi:MAG: hypothetical protein ACOH18_04630 [Candidatus Saccharimonadaceae bacterium]
MPFHAENPYLATRTLEMNNLMAFAMRRTPEEYFTFISQPILRQLAEVAGLRTIAEYCQEGGIETEAIDLFEAGITTLIPPLTAIVQAQPELTQSQAITIMNSEKTSELLLAIGQQELRRIYEDEAQPFTLSNDGTAITLAYPIHTNPNPGNEVVNSLSLTPEITPILKKFIPWAGSLAVLAHFEHQ